MNYLFICNVRYFFNSIHDLLYYTIEIFVEGHFESIIEKTLEQDQSIWCYDRPEIWLKHVFVLIKSFSYFVLKCLETYTIMFSIVKLIISIYTYFRTENQKLYRNAYNICQSKFAFQFDQIINWRIDADYKLNATNDPILSRALDYVGAVRNFFVHLLYFIL